jgi:hypothetical protein
MANQKKNKKKKIVWDPEPAKSDFQHPHLRPKEKGEEILIHRTFKK